MDLTPRARELLKALKKTKAADGWMPRAEIGRKSGKRRLSPHDIDLLDKMTAAGWVERRRRESKSPVGYAFDYRLVRKEQRQ